MPGISVSKCHAMQNRPFAQYADACDHPILRKRANTLLCLRNSRPNLLAGRMPARAAGVAKRHLRTYAEIVPVDAVVALRRQAAVGAARVEQPAQVHAFGVESLHNKYLQATRCRESLMCQGQASVRGSGRLRISLELI